MPGPSSVTDIVAEESAVVDHYKVTREAPAAYHIATLQARLGRSTNFSSHSISLGGALIRNDAGAVLSEGTEATLNGLYIVNGTQHVDNHTVIDHALPHANSHELYKGILDGRANAVFNGRIIVRKDAQKTDARMACNTLLMSDDAEFSVKPELEIFADDVQCGHGATVADIDHNHLYYLMARGVPRSKARAMLVNAFVAEIVEELDDETLVEALEDVISAWLEKHA